ncbi:hypothetical protein YB2330_006295 [Saitoella coloradoensis]
METIVILSGPIQIITTSTQPPTTPENAPSMSRSTSLPIPDSTSSKVDQSQPFRSLRIKKSSATILARSSALADNLARGAAFTPPRHPLSTRDRDRVTSGPGLVERSGKLEESLKRDAKTPPKPRKPALISEVKPLALEDEVKDRLARAVSGSLELKGKAEQNKEKTEQERFVEAVEEKSKTWVVRREALPIPKKVSIPSFLQQWDQAFQSQTQQQPSQPVSPVESATSTTTFSSTRTLKDYTAFIPIPQEEAPAPQVRAAPKKVLRDVPYANMNVSTGVTGIRKEREREVRSVSEGSSRVRDLAARFARIGSE